jgi:hypothetical protein
MSSGDQEYPESLDPKASAPEDISVNEDPIGSEEEIIEEVVETVDQTGQKVTRKVKRKRRVASANAA